MGENSLTSLTKSLFRTGKVHSVKGLLRAPSLVDGGMGSGLGSFPSIRYRESLKRESLTASKVEKILSCITKNVLSPSSRFSLFPLSHDRRGDDKKRQIRLGTSHGTPVPVSTVTVSRLHSPPQFLSVVGFVSRVTKTLC